MRNKTILPVLLTFFVMGFVDLVGIASTFMKDELGLTDAQANILPMLVFLWFLFCSVPTSILMNKIGKKRTVIVSLIVTLVSLVIPIFDASYYTMFFALSLLGIGNALMQTSLNPLMTLIVADEKLASAMTFGQFIKAIASFLAPIICSAGFAGDIFDFGLSWRILFPIYGIIGVVITLWLSGTEIIEDTIQEQTEGVVKTVMNCFRLLGNPFIFLSFISIMCHVGIDVGVNVTAPRLLTAIGVPLNEAAWATSTYFVARTMGCLTGSYFLQKFSTRTFYAVSLGMIAVALLCLMVGDNLYILYAGIILVGYGNSNTFSMCFAQALLDEPKRQNEASGLMIMGLIGGSVFPFVMGLAADSMGSQLGAVAVMAASVLYLFYYLTRMKA